MFTMKRLTLLLVAVSVMMLLTGCCCFGQPCGGGCPGGGCPPGYGAAIGQGSYYGPYGSAQVITPTYAAAPAPTLATQTASYAPLQPLPTY
jgi:hypothetical protein